MFTHENLVGYLKASTTAVDDKTALLGAELYPQWESLSDGAEIAQGTRVRHTDVLWKCIKTHNKQANWAPSIHTASLWTAINEEHAGTIDDPIPVPEILTSFEYEWGKYYKEGDTLYLCNRQGGKPGDKYELSYKPSQLVGHYFEIVQ